MSTRNDRSLRFYHEVLGLEHLHYGLWLPEDELSFDNLKKAQQRYEDYLIENLPEDVTRVLDVGCGTCSLSSRLHQMGLEVEGLSPDINQKTIFTKKLNRPFHHCRFEQLATDQKFDCLIMSESAQYIRQAELFSQARNFLKDGGYLMICDYFVLNDGEGDEPLNKSGHHYDSFLAKIKDSDFTVVRQEDLTPRVVKTLEFGRFFADKAFLAFDIGTEKYRLRHPHVTRLIAWLFRKRISRLNSQLDLVDVQKFMSNKKYIFLLLQVSK